MSHKAYLPYLMASMVLTLSTTSCFELMDLEPDIPGADPGILSLPVHEVDIMVGDSILLQPRVEPDSAHLDILWFTDWEGDDAPLTFDGSMITAVHEGQLTVYVKALGLNDVAINDSITPEAVIDSCRVNVFAWRDEVPRTERGYDMIIHADIVINDSIPFDPETMEVVALAGDEVIGQGVLLEEYGRQYTYFRLWRNEIDYVPLTLQLYDHSRIRRTTLIHPPLYFDGETHGSLSSLFYITGHL